MFVRPAGAAVASAARSHRGGVSSLSGRVLFRSNEKPKASLDVVVSEMGRDFFHVRTQPAVMAVLKQRMGRGIQMATTFTFKHFAGDSTWLDAMHELQVDNLPPGFKMEEADVIDCGFRSGERRKLYETVFTVIFPDVKDGMDMRQGGADVLPDAGGYAAGAWHPQSHLTKFDMPMFITNGAGGGGGGAGSQGKKGGKKAGRKGKGNTDEAKASGGIVNLLLRLIGGGKGGSDGPAKDDEEEGEEDGE